MPSLRRHSEDDPAFQQMERAMNELAHPSSEDHLSESTKAQQRAELLALASSMPSQPSQAPASSPTPVSTQRKRIFMYAAGFAMAVLVLNLVISAIPGRHDTNGTVARLLVPASQSAEAFSLTPVKSSVGGIDPQEGWTLRTSVPASAEAIQRALTIEPATTVHIDRIDDQSWSIVPDEALDQNTVYRVQLAAALQNGSTETPYEYSWVNQTSGAFQLDSMTPGPGAAYAPLDTAIEWTFSHAGFADATSSITFTPAIAGHFETRDRTLVFLPDRPLKPGQVYHVRVKAGFGISDDQSMRLQNDLEYAFQTQNDESYRPESQLYLPDEQEVATGKSIEIPFAQNANSAPLRIDGYKLNSEEAEAYLRLRSPQYGYFSWNDSSLEPVDALVKDKQAILALDNLKPATRASYYGGQETYVTIPAQGAGYYLLRVTRPGATKDYTLVQVTDIAVQALTDYTAGLFWAVDAKTRQPISGATAKIEDVSAQTGDDGVARLSLPADLTTPNALQLKTAIARIQRNGQEVLVQVQPSYMPWWFGSGPMTDTNEGLRRTWSYMYVDRFTQRQADTINIFGLALDRTSKQPAGNLKLRLVPNDFSYRVAGASATPTLEEKDIVVDANGRYQSSFSWTNRSLGSYEIQLVRDGKIVDSQWFTIKEDAKPRMTLSVSLDRDSVLASEFISGSVLAKFADGTPYPNADVRVRITQSTVGPLADLVVHTNDQGKALFRAQTTRPPACRASTLYAGFEGGCFNFETADVSAVAATGEEGEASAGGSVSIHAASTEVIGTDYPNSAPQVNRLSPTTAQITARTQTVQATLTGTDAVMLPNQPVNVDLYRVNVTQVQTGTVYDEVEKRVRPVMNDVRTLVLESHLTSSSDQSGNLSLGLSLSSSSSEYQVLMSTNDGQGRKSFVQVWMPPYYNQATMTPGGVPGIPMPEAFTLDRMENGAAVPYNEDRNRLNLNQRIRLAVNVDGKAVSTQKYSRPLFVVASRGIVTSVLSANEGYDLTFDERIYPSATIYGFVFTDHGFEMVSDSYFLNTDPYVLTVDASTDKTEYLPGSTADVRLKVTNAQGQTVSGAKVMVSVADKMLESLGAFSGQIPVSSLYRGVDTGVQGMASTHLQAKAMNGGAEGGGGAGDDALFQPRKNFKDQADFQVVETDAAGQATAHILIPDNITTWRIEAVAISKDLQAGNVVIDRPATKPLAVDAVIPRTLQVGDQAQLKLRPIADMLADTEEVTYAVNAPTLGINGQTVKTKGRANVYIPVTVTEAMIGTHTIQVGALTKDHQDAMEFTLRVVPRGYTKTIWEQAAATDNFRLPDSLAPESTVIITSSQRSGLLPDVQSLVSMTGTTRLESLVAASMAAKLLPSVGASSTEVTAIDWTLYQVSGLRSLPQSSESLDTSFNLAFSGEGGFDKASLTSYFRQTAQATDATRETRLKAVAGLAMLGQPVLPSLQTAASQTDLTWKEEAILLKTFVSIGDREQVKTIFTRWMAKSQENDGRIFINVDSSERQRVDATKVAVLAAGFLSDEHFDKLSAYVTKANVESVTYDPILDARIVALRVAHSPQEEAKVTYRIGDQTQEANLKDGPIWIPLTGTTWDLFSIVSVQGPVTVQWSRRVPGVPEQTSGLAITRRYTSSSGKGDQFREGDMVTVTLSPTMTNRDTFACYEIRDRLPAGLRPVIAWQFTEKGWSPSVQSEGEMRFTACSNYQDPITYTAQVITPGVYTAPAPIIQNIDQPSLAAIGAESTFTSIKRTQ